MKQATAKPRILEVVVIQNLQKTLERLATSLEKI